MKQLFDRLSEMIKEYDNIITVGHKDPDLDSLGSCLGLAEIVESFGEKAYVFLNDKHLERYNNNINQAFEKMQKKITYINERNYSRIEGKTLVIVTDVHTQDRLEYPKLVDSFDTVVIDHHIKSKNYIKSAKKIYIDTNLSSMSELVTYYANYLKLDLDNVIATVLLAGIEIDTNGYNLKTTGKTYEAAAILMDMGADSILKQELLKETKEEYIKRATFIRNSFMVNDKIAMCVINETINNISLAEVAEELLTFEDVKASFVIGRLDENLIGISARSLGEIDVSKYIKMIGGGGHPSNAAAQVSDKSIKDLKQELIKLIGIDF